MKALQKIRTAAIGIPAIMVTAGALAQDRPVPDTFLAVTTNMTPAEVELKADVLHWSTPEQRAAAIAAMQEEDPSAALQELPSLGVIWRSGSAVGNAIKYAQRTTTPDGEVITFVTDRAIGSTSFNPWVADQSEAADVPPYSVVQMSVAEGRPGTGTMSLAADVVFDTDANTVTLDASAMPPVLTNTRMAPKPYWATAD